MFVQFYLTCIIWAATLTSLSTATAAQKIPVIIDTDMAIDDWLAMIYLLQHPEADVLGITVTGAGEVHCKPGLPHTVDLVDVTPQKGIPVACGPSEPLDGYHDFPALWREGADTFYGVPLKSSKRKPDDRPAPDLLISLLERSATPVRLVILGNATNVALAFEKAPQIKKKIERIYFMGGAIRAKGNIIVPGFTDHYPNKTSEWNIFIDPLAARLVLASGVPVTLVPLDATNLVRVTAEDAATLKRTAKTQGAKFFSQILDKTKWFIDSGEYYFWDALTAVVVFHPQFCQYEELDLDVVAGYSAKTNGVPLPAYGTKRWDGKPRRNFDPYLTGHTLISDRGYPTKVCMTVDDKAFKSELMSGINKNP